MLKWPGNSTFTMKLTAENKKNAKHLAYLFTRNNQSELFRLSFDLFCEYNGLLTSLRSKVRQNRYRALIRSIVEDKPMPPQYLEPPEYEI